MIIRRRFERRRSPGWMSIYLLGMLLAIAPTAQAADRPNILIAISDDQSYPHASAYGYRAISTPAFDRIARQGVLCRNAFTPCPGCSPMRAAFLTGRNIWQLEQAGTHASSFPVKYTVFPDALEQAGYFVGFTGKGWAPGNWQVSGRERNPAGRDFSARTNKTPRGIHSNDYGANFSDFLAARPADRPFCFWYGGHEPHRPFPKGIGRAKGLDPTKVVVPPFLPDTSEVRDDLLDYCYEIEWFDRHLQRMLAMLEASSELDNTLVIVTSDNGMSFPRAKANVYEYGVHMPLAVCWPSAIPGGRTVDDPINLIDLTATIYEATGVSPPSDKPPMGRGLLTLLQSDGSGIVDPSRDAIFCGRERHSSSRVRSLGYPQRAIRTRDYLYIRNFRPERWPAGAPQKYGAGMYVDSQDVIHKRFGPMHAGYHDIDRCPTLTAMIQYQSDPRY
ncbi:MAG: sulfatase, partial [Pirellulales bacterium]